MNRQMRLLGVSYSYPPFSFPRSIQVSRLLSALDAETTILCADDTEVRRDETILPEGQGDGMSVIRMPFHIGLAHKVLRRFREHLDISLPLMLPDPCIFWVLKVLKTGRAVIEDRRPDALVTFGMPMSDHILGLWLKKKYGLPWIAHFSDPWVDNPYIRFSPASRWANCKLEALVMRHADALVFTNKEATTLITGKYSASIRSKARVLHHAFDPARYGKNETKPDLVVRHVGAFYGLRSPAPFLDALRSILRESPALLHGFRFEFIGPVEERLKATTDLSGMEGAPVSFHPPVGYQESLDLMASAGGLLLVDAPMEKSPFFPSKLADYFGAGRPIMGITPEGPARRLIQDYSQGFTASPGDRQGIRQSLSAFLERVRSAPTPSPPEMFRRDNVAETFMEILRETVEDGAGA